VSSAPTSLDNRRPKKRCADRPSQRLEHRSHGVVDESVDPSTDIAHTTDVGSASDRDD
jgi:hypothetical protein